MRCGSRVRFTRQAYKKRTHKKQLSLSSVECMIDEWLDLLRPVRRNGDGHLLRVGTAQFLVYSRLRCVLCTRLGLRLSSRRVAIWFGGGGMVGHRSAAVVGYTE